MFPRQGGRTQAKPPDVASDRLESGLLRLPAECLVLTTWLGTANYAPIPDQQGILRRQSAGCRLPNC
jgi:hypothetical protein